MSRQALTPFQRSPEQERAISRGGYILIDAPKPQVVLIATGSEVEIAAQAAQQLTGQGVAVLVSMPCVEIFYVQNAAYRNSVLPIGVPRVSIEAGVTWFWRALVGEQGIALGIDSFGESAPADQLYRHFKLTPEHVSQCALSLLMGDAMNSLDPPQSVILFDLDGTLVDTAPDIVAAANLMLDELNAPALSFELISSFIGNGVSNLVRCVLNASELTDKMKLMDVSFAEEIFFQHYRQTNGQIGAVFPAVVAGLKTLKKTGYRLACVTNKPVELAQILLRIAGLSGYFELVVGGNSLAQMKPAAEPLLHACCMLGGSVEHALMVGDSAVDIAAARAAGMSVLIFNYGYPGCAALDALSCDAFIDSLEEIPAFIASERKA